MNSNAGSLPSTLRIESMNTSKQTGAERPGKDFCAGKKSSLCLPLMSRAGGGSKQNLSAYSQTQFQLGLQRQWLVVKRKKKKTRRKTWGWNPEFTSSICRRRCLCFADVKCLHNIYIRIIRRMRKALSATLSAGGSWDRELLDGEKQEWHWSLVSFAIIISLNPSFDAPEWLICSD